MAGSKLENRLKRKNMANSGCPDPLYNGVDLNRNFPVGFNLSTNTNCKGSRDGFCGGCSNTFGGRQPFSEPETEALRSALTEAPPWLFIDIHASLGAWLTPPVSRSALSCFPMLSSQQAKQTWRASRWLEPRLLDRVPQKQIQRDLQHWPGQLSPGRGGGHHA